MHNNPLGQPSSSSDDSSLPNSVDAQAPTDAHGPASDASRAPGDTNEAGDADAAPSTSPPRRTSTARDPLHGVTLETMLLRLVDRHGWDEMGYRIPIRCFLFEPSVKSSLAFLRRTPWARKKVEDWYAYDARRFPMDEQ